MSSYVKVQMTCSKCGKDISIAHTYADSSGDLVVEIEPCKCEEKKVG